MEILGQLLKSYYGSIKNTTKEEISAEILSAPLRALRDFYCCIEKDSDAFINEIEGFLKSKNGSLNDTERKEIAKRFAYQIIGMVTTSLILKPAAAIASPNLKEVISNVVDSNPTTAFKLIKVASDLELPGNINHVEIKNLYADVENDMFCQRILQTLVLKHLYLFKVEESEKQRICDITKIPIERQHKIDFKAKGSKVN